MATLPPAPDELPPAPDELPQEVEVVPSAPDELPPAPDEVPAAVQPAAVQAEPGFLERQVSGAQRKWKGLDDPSLQAWAHEVSGIAPEAIGDRSTPEQQEAYRHWNLARNAGMRGMQSADEAGHGSELARSGSQSAIGVRSIPGMVARLALRVQSSIDGKDSLAAEAYEETLRDYYTQKAYDEQAKLAGTIGQVAGAVADPLSLAGGMGIGKGLALASKASPLAAKALGGTVEVASKGGFLQPAAGTVMTKFAPGANLAQQGVRAGVEGLATGAATGSLEAAAGGQDLERAALAGVSGAVGGALLGGAAPAIGGAAGKVAGEAVGQAKKVPVLDKALTYMRHFGTAVQERLRNGEDALGMVHFLEGKMPAQEKLGEIHTALEASDFAKTAKVKLGDEMVPVMDAVRGGKFKHLERLDQAKILAALPVQERYVAAATMLHHANVAEGTAMLKALDVAEQGKLVKYNPNSAPDASGRLNFTQIREMVGPENFDTLRLEELDTKRGIDNALKTAQAMPDSVGKDALIEGLNYKKAVYTEGQRIANTFGLENATIDGYSHRFRKDGVDEAAIANAQENPDRITSQSGETRKVDVTKENLGAYEIEGEVKNYVDNFEKNHMSGKGGMNGIIGIANKLPKELEAMQKAIKDSQTGSLKGLEEGKAVRTKGLSDINTSMMQSIEELKARQEAEIDAARKAHVIPAVEADAADQAAAAEAAGFGNTSIPKAPELRATQAAELEALSQRHATELNAAREAHAKAAGDMMDANAKADADDLSKYQTNLKEQEAADKQIDDMIKTLAQGQKSDLKGRMVISSPEKGLAGIKNIFAARMSHSSLSDTEKRLIQDAANAHFERTLNPQSAGAVEEMSQRTMHLLNAINPGVVASILLDPLSIIASGNTKQLAQALADTIKVPNAKQVIEASKGAIFTPIKAIAEVAKGDWREGGKMAHDYLTKVTKEMHGFMDSVNMNSSVRDIVDAKANAVKFRKSFGEKAYERAYQQGQEWMKTKGEIPKGSELFRMAKLVANEKLPTDTMAQTEFYNKITKDPLGRFAVQNGSFTANRLNNTIRVANELIQKSDTPGMRQHAIVSAAQLTLLGLVIEKMFFDKVYEFSSNDVYPQHRKETAATAVNDLTGISRLLRAPPLIGKALQVVNDFSKPESFITRNPGKLVSTPASHVSGFIPAAARTLKAGEKMVNGWVKQP
jgi:hypothetical protein